MRQEHALPFASTVLPLDPLETQVAVVGAGAAGLYTAICAARAGAGVTLISATPLAESSTYWAQGGLAAAIAPDDSPERHLADTVKAGRGAVRESAARGAVRGGARARSRTSSSSGCRSTPTATVASRSGSRAATRCGGSCTPGGAATGQRLIRQLSALVAEHPRIEVLEDRRAVALVVGERALLRASCSIDGRAAGERGDGARDRRRRGAVGAHHQPGRGRRRRAAARVRGGRAARRPRVRPVPSDRRRRDQRRGRLPRDRGDPRRGRDPARRRRASGSSTSSRRATRSPGRCSSR